MFIESCILGKDGPFGIDECGEAYLKFSNFLDEFLSWTFYGPLTLKGILGQFSFLVMQKKSYYEDIVEDFLSSKVYPMNIFKLFD